MLNEEPRARGVHRVLTAHRCERAGQLVGQTVARTRLRRLAARNRTWSRGGARKSAPRHYRKGTGAAGCANELQHNQRVFRRRFHVAPTENSAEQARQRPRPTRGARGEAAHAAPTVRARALRLSRRRRPAVLVEEGHQRRRAGAHARTRCGAPVRHARLANQRHALEEALVIVEDVGGECRLRQQQ